jgi:hypothetical protein
MDKRTEPNPVRWRWGAAAALSMMILSLYPQAHFWWVRGAEWNGSYAAIEGVGDEAAYSAYVNSLIEGRPRINDPYTGRDSNNHAPQRNSLFSIQFVPAYLIALPARAFGLSASTTFIVLSPLAAGATALVLFWLLALGTGQGNVAAAGVPIVLCFGTLVAGHGHFSSFFGQEPLYNYLMFLRRYQPAATFPLFLAFCATAWLAISSHERKRAWAATISSTVIFGLLVFSYVFLWTAAAAWLLALALLWAAARPAGWRASMKNFAVIAMAALIAIICFAIPYSNRALTMDSVQALERSHAPDLFRIPELIGIGLLVVIGYFWKRGTIDVRSSNVLLATSFASLPLLLFNQQVVTGLSLQPLHYEMFAANYSVLISSVIAAAIIGKKNNFRLRMPRKALLLVALAAFEWGAYETLVATRGSLALAKEIDEARPVAIRLAEIAAAEASKGKYPTVLSTDLLIADSFPTSAPQSLLWAPHLPVFSGVTDVEGKERFYQYLYYTGVRPEQLKNILLTEGRYGFAAGLFGYERTIRGLSRQFKPVTHQELDIEVKRYSDYTISFSSQQASQIKLSYVVVPAKASVDLSNLDRWYQRDSGERIGRFILYRTQLRSELPDPEVTKSNAAPERKPPA